MHAPHEWAQVWLASFRNEACGPQLVLSKRRVQCTGPKELRASWPTHCLLLLPLTQPTDTMAQLQQVRPSLACWRSP